MAKFYFVLADIETSTNGANILRFSCWCSHGYLAIERADIYSLKELVLFTLKHSTAIGISVAMTIAEFRAIAQGDMILDPQSGEITICLSAHPGVTSFMVVTPPAAPPLAWKSHPGLVFNITTDDYCDYYR